ncbi:MAG: Holliday junction branch migration protein RuvA [Proteobacteria bacterium]|uniref:Holliday junction branch migration protein RuvA n=1 Tax=Plasticicumulans sp. TaxID=2307179 RepID=UPI000FB7A0BD|nr:Holliday junction branch migration protein RuvA [Pseudomonadota bacterium]RTL03385.1 MAG: Holliday junction branch migration protein RuvA [Xanthomonadales bacterium]HNF64506.1 Holliday junction branch migration protein RuvA [Plasticicumulans sp.]
MIGRLRGRLILRQPPLLMIELGNGLAYELEASLSTCCALPETGAEVVLYTHLAVREDAQVLYGFGTLAERTLFRNLIRVTGIGAKLALVILSGMSVDAFARCLEAGDVATLIRLPGIGRKTAERLVVEMRDRIQSLELGAEFASRLPARAPDAPPDPVQDAEAALVALGYKPADATRMVRAVAADGLPSEELIRRALAATLSRG